MKKKITKTIVLTSFLVITAWLAVNSALAADSLNVGLEPVAATGLSVADPRVIIANIIRIALGFLGIVAVVLIIYGGWVWMTANGEEEKVQKAKKILTGAAIGLVICLSAFALANFILSRLISATGGGSDTAGGGSGGGTGASGYTFSITSTRPVNQATGVVRNVVIKTFFNKVLSDQVSQTVLAANFKVEKIANINSASKAETALAAPQLIVGTAEITDGRLVINFKDSDDCGDEQGTLNCLPAWSKFKVTVNGYSGIVSAGNQSLSCSLGSACEFVFSTGDLLDTRPPTAGLVPAQICQDDGSLKADANTVMGWGRDDLGIAALRFTQKKDGQASEQTALVVPGSGQTYQSYSYKYNTTGLAAGDKYSFGLYAYDQANQTASGNFTTVIKPGHCCNGLKDGNETEIDCGGDCLACLGGACHKAEPNQCGTGSANCDNNLCSTFFCDCQSGACRCGTKPIIFNVSPDGGFCSNDKNKFCAVDADCGAGGVCDTDTPNGAAGNFVSITGRYFGDTAGKVLFSDNKVAALASSVNASCSGAWSDSQIIAVVPAGANTGSLKVQDKNNNFDTTNDDRGPQVKDFLVNNLKRPGVCSVNPDSGFLNDQFNLQGSAFNGTGQAVLFGGNASFVAANNTTNWTNISVDAAVPNLATGPSSVFVKVNNLPSNKLSFTVKSDAARNPAIDYIEPAAGPAGQYITIYGRNFKTYNAQKSSVKFYLPADPANLINADIDFPEACRLGWWHDNYIVVKVPKADNLGAYKVVVNSSDGRASAPADFTINSGTPAPGLCLLDPNNGPAGQPVAAFGERFGSTQGSGRMQYFNNQDGSLRSWTSQKIDSNVPTGAASGPVKVITSQGGISNSLPFKVGKCSTSSQCSSGEECCGAGSLWSGVCRKPGSCSEGLAGSCGFSWNFRTSAKQAGDLCYSGGAVGSCDVTKSQCGANLVCDAASCVCKKSCNGNTGSSAQCLSDNSRCGAYSGAPVCNQDTCLCECTDSSQCPTGQTCDRNTGTCGSNQIESCAGYGSQCAAAYFCPNSPGKCSTNSGGQAKVGVSCGNQACGELTKCQGSAGTNLCSYSAALNQCKKISGSCDLNKSQEASGLTDVNGNKVALKCGSVDGRNVWYYDSQQSCVSGYAKSVDGSKCLGPACSACPVGFACSAENGAGVCALDKTICPAGSSCSNNECTRQVQASCECCCNKANNTAAGNPDCCPGLTCDNTCGSGGDFGLCTGCTVETAGGSVDQAAANAKCNCSGTSGKYCDTAGADGLGVCKDCASVSSLEECNNKGAGVCCVDAQKNTCRAGAGKSAGAISHSGPNYSYCAYYACADTGNACAAKPVASSTAAVYLTSVDCQIKCSNITLPGQACVKEDGSTQKEVCDNSICTSLACLNSDGAPVSASACGTCCCDPGRQDQCASPLKCQADRGSCTGVSRGLCCGCSADGDCGSAETVGCGADFCCQVRPLAEEVKPTGANVCRNNLIQAIFNQPMQVSSFRGNVVVAANYGADQCPAGLQPLTAVYQPTLAGKIKSWLAGLPLVSKLFAGQARAEELSGNFCAITGAVSGTDNGSKTILGFAPARVLEANRTYYVIIKGDSNLADAAKAGVLSQAGVSLKPTDHKVFNGVAYDGKIWSFTTRGASQTDSGICQLNYVKVDPASYLFTTAVNDSADDIHLVPPADKYDTIKDSDKVFNATAYSVVGQPIVPFANVYDWRWDWTIDDQAVVKFKNGSSDANSTSQTLVAQNVKDDNTLVRAKATITADTANQQKSAGKEISGAAQAYVMLCANPWPAYKTDAGGNLIWQPWRDTSGNCSVAGGSCHNTNFELYYCRDAGGPGTADDLPAILSDTAVIRPDAAQQNILKEFYFFRENQ